MALYPIRLLKDKNRHPFFPFNTLESVLVDGTNLTLADVLDDIYDKEEINTMFATELSKFSVYSSVQELPATARAGAVAAVNANNTYLMYMYYDGSWHTLTQKGDKGASFEYDWDGTRLGVKTDEEQNYEYVDLKGAKGDPGNTLFASFDIVDGDLIETYDVAFSGVNFQINGAGELEVII